MDSYTVILGNNVVENCAAALILEGEEVFRIREEEDGQLLIDCDIRDQNGQRIAKIARNSVAFVAEGFVAKVRPHQPAEVIREPTGEVVAKIERLGRRKIKVTGSFCVNGFWATVTNNGVFVPGISISGNTIAGFGTAIKLGRGQTELGCV